VQRGQPHAERAWAAGAGPDLTGLLQIDLDATITISHSEDKENAAKTWKRTFGHQPLLAFLDRPEVSGGEALAGLLRPGNAGSNTAADHITVLDQALAALPAQARPVPGDPDSVRVVVRSDSPRRHPRLRPGVPGSWGVVLLRIPRRRPHPSHCRSGSRTLLGTRDRDRWRDPRRCLGCPRSPACST
jgi:hypothetical protein